MKANVSWGSHVYQKISKDLIKELTEVKPFSPRNLQYMNQFYRLYSVIGITPQSDVQIDKEIIFFILGDIIKILWVNAGMINRKPSFTGLLIWIGRDCLAL